MQFVMKPELIWFVGAYLLLLVGLGVYYSRKIESSDDFVLANKSLGSWVLAGTFLGLSAGTGRLPAVAILWRIILAYGRESFLQFPGYAQLSYFFYWPIKSATAAVTRSRNCWKKHTGPRPEPLPA